MSVTQIYNTIFLIFFMGGPEGTNLLGHFEAEVDWTGGIPLNQEWFDPTANPRHPSRQNPFSGFAYYEDRPKPKKEKKKMGNDWDMFTSSYKGIKSASNAWKMYKHMFPGAGFKRGIDTTMTKDMIIGPHRKKRLGTGKKVNVGQQLKQLVDDTKVFKQQFKLKITSGDGLRNWAQIVCRHRQTPGKSSSGSGTFTPNGVVLKPDEIADVQMPDAPTVPDYYNGLPPVPIGEYSSVSNNYWLFGQDVPDNLLYLNMPLTYLEQDMFNMGLGPGKRAFTQYMNEASTGGAPEDATTKTDEHLPYVGDPELKTAMTAGINKDRLTSMMTPIRPIEQMVSFYMEGSQVGRTLMTNGADENLTTALNGYNSNRAVYPFQKGWGIHHLDYNMVASNGTYDPNGSYPSELDPQWLKTNNSMNTKATIKSGKISFTFNNMGESQCYVNTLVVVNKHVDSHYYSMPQALTDQYLKAAQHYINSGEWSITNNVTNPNASSDGHYTTAYMHVTHPSIKPFGEIPARFLENFNKHFSIKYQTTTKLGIGERQSCSINLGGLTYTTDQIAMNYNSVHSGTPLAEDDYYPIDPSLSNVDGPEVTGGLRADFPLCCQQGTTHFLIGIQGMSLPYVDTPVGDAEPSVTTVHGRWAVPALVDISGTYTEVIGPLQVVPAVAPPRQKTRTALPNANWQPIVTTLPRVRTTTNGNMTLNLT